MGDPAPGKGTETGAQQAAVWQHGLDAALGGAAFAHAEAAFQGVADDARLRPRIGRLKPPFGRSGGEFTGKLSLGDSRLDHGIAECFVDVDDTVQVAEIKDDPVTG
jgi:hypothetical protein